MRHTKEAARWGLFEWIVTLLLTMSTALLGACALLDVAPSFGGRPRHQQQRYG